MYRRTFVRTVGGVSALGGIVGVSTARGGRTHHVRPGDGIQRAIDEAEPGDVIVVHDGEYVQPRITGTTPHVEIHGAGDAVVIADSDSTDGRNHHATFATREPGIALRNLEFVRVVDDSGAAGSGHTKVLGVRNSRTTVTNCTVRLEDATGEDDQSSALWIATRFNEDAPTVEDVRLSNNYVSGDPSKSAEGRNALAIASLSDVGDARNVRVTNNRIGDGHTGLATADADIVGRDGEVENVTVVGNRFENNEVHVVDDADAIDRERGNRFD